MVSSRELKQRISSVQSTQKLTKVMKLISTSYIKRIGNALKRNNESLRVTTQTLAGIISANSKLQHPLLSRTRETRTRLLILVTANKGLCGYYNIAVIKKCFAEIQKILSKNEQLKIICIGNKGYSALKKKYEAHIIDNLDLLHRGKLCTLDEVQELRNRLINMYETRETDDISIVHTQFVTGINFTPTRTQVIPIIPANIIASCKPIIYNDPIYDVSQDTILSVAVEHYTDTLLYNILANSYMSEESARMMAMDSAVKNTESLTNDLKKELNRNRQNAITSTLIDIVNSSEAS